MLSGRFETCSGMADFYGLRIHVCVYVRVHACVLCGAWHVKGCREQTLQTHMLRFPWERSGVSGRKEKEESTLFVSVQGWDPHV